MPSKFATSCNSNYGLDLPKIVIEQPPRVELGEYALPLAFELAKKLRKPPRKIAEEIVAGIGPIEGFEKLELAGGGYINARVKREVLAAALAADEKPKADIPAGKVLVEHSSINPNKAAHIGHLRNAILGDTFVRLLHFAGREVDVQNYIDNTGVQVADVIVGFLRLEKKPRAEIEELTPPAAFRLLLPGTCTRKFPAGTNRTSRTVMRVTRCCTPWRKVETRPPRSLT